MKKLFLLLPLATALGCQGIARTDVTDRPKTPAATCLAVDSNIEPIADGQQYTVDTRLRLFRNGQWVLVGEPKLTISADGREGSMSIVGSNLQYEVRATVSKAVPKTVQVVVDFQETGAAAITTSQTVRIATGRM